MDLLNNPLLRRTLAPQPAPDPYAEPRKRLLDALLQMRDRARMLAGEIHRDLPDFTVHDITHLDALWEMADLIAGPDYPLNPLEAFALGAVFLLHDLGLGLAAYPGGLAELKKGPGWQDAVATSVRKQFGRFATAEELASPPQEIERMAARERLRALHTEHAERLALTSWRYKEGPEYYLIEDPDLRQMLGPVIGKVLNSIGSEVLVIKIGLIRSLGVIRGALPGFPVDWTMDTLKLAALFRISDAILIDSRRPLGSPHAFHSEGLPREFRTFAEHLLKPRIDANSIVYTTGWPFSPDEKDEWRLCVNTLSMLSSELAEVDALLASSGRPRLRAWRVQGADGKLSSFRSYIELSDAVQPVRSIIIEDASVDDHSTLHRKRLGPSDQKPINTFLSYKWGSDAENAWVMKLASDLRGAGIDAILDRWEVRLGDSFTQYMTTKIQQADVFLFVITTASVSSLEDPGYGGALKFEMQLASARRIAGENVRVIGIYREGNATPGYLRDHRYVDFRDEAVYTLRLRELVDDLLGRIQPPPLGGVG